MPVDRQRAQVALAIPRRRRAALFPPADAGLVMGADNVFDIATGSCPGIRSCRRRRCTCRMTFPLRARRCRWVTSPGRGSAIRSHRICVGMRRRALPPTAHGGGQRSRMPSQEFEILRPSTCRRQPDCDLSTTAQAARAEPSRGYLNFHEIVDAYHDAAGDPVPRSRMVSAGHPGCCLRDGGL